MEVQRVQENKNILEKEQSWRTRHLLISKFTTKQQESRKYGTGKRYTC